MSANIDLYFDSGGGGLLSKGSAPAGQIPILTRNDTYNFRIRVQDAPIGQVPVDVDLTGTSLRLGIGEIDQPPTDGTFVLSLNSTTSPTISYNATTTSLYNAISGIAGAVSVSSYDDGYLITAATANTALSFGADGSLLFPTSSVLISTRKNPATGVYAQQTIVLRQSPAVYANNFTLVPTAGQATLTKTQTGTATANESYRLYLGPDAEGGSFVLNFGTNSTTALAVNATAISVSQALGAVTGIGASNISVAELVGEGGYSISFVRSLGQQALATALSLDPSGIYFAPWKASSVTLSTAELDNLFASEGTVVITPTLEVELVDGGNPKTLFQGNVSIRKDLINSTAVIPVGQDSYYTKAESDSIFATIVTVNTNYVTTAYLTTNYYTKLQVDDLIDSITGGPVTGDYYTKAQSDARFPTTAAISASYYTKGDSDSRYPTTAAISASYYSKVESDSRYPTTASISASYYTKTESSNLFVEDSASNVSASSRQLVNSATQVIVDWESGAFGYGGVLRVATATTASGITISTILNITTQTVVSGDLIVYGTLSAGPISAGDYYTKSQADSKFVINSTTGVYSTDRSLRGSDGNKDLEWGTSQVIIRESLVVTAGGTLGVDGASTLEGQVNMLAGFAAIGGSSISNGSLLITNGGMTIEQQSVSGTLVLGFNSINGPSANATLQDITCRDISCNDINSAGDIIAATISAGSITIGSITTTTFSLTSVTANILNVTSKFGFGGSTPVTRFESVNATSINTITTVTWSPIRVCSGGTAVTRWFLIGSATANAPSFLGYDEEVRKITRQVVHILSQNYFGFVNAVSLTYP